MGSPYRKQGTTCLWCENSPSCWVLVAKLQTGAYQQMPRERICYHAVKVVNKFSQNLKAEQGPAGLWRGGVERGGGGGANIAQGEAAAGYKQSPWVTDSQNAWFSKVFVCLSIYSFFSIFRCKSTSYFAKTQVVCQQTIPSPAKTPFKVMVQFL